MTTEAPKDPITPTPTPEAIPADSGTPKVENEYQFVVPDANPGPNAEPKADATGKKESDNSEPGKSDPDTKAEAGGKTPPPDPRKDAESDAPEPKPDNPDKANLAKKVEQLGYATANQAKTLTDIGDALKQLLEAKSSAPTDAASKDTAKENAEEKQEAKVLDALRRKIKASMDSEDADEWIDSKTQGAQLIEVLDAMETLASGTGNPQKASTELTKQIEALRAEVEVLKAPQRESQELKALEKMAPQLVEQFPNVTVDAVKKLWPEVKAEMQEFGITSAEGRNAYWTKRLETANGSATKPAPKVVSPPKSPKVHRPDESTEGTEIAKGASASVPAARPKDPNQMTPSDIPGIPKFIV